MRSIANRLTPKDKKALALFYQTDAQRALSKLMKMMVGNAAKHCLSAPDFMVVKHLQGQEFSLRELDKLLKEVYDADVKVVPKKKR